MVLMDPQFKYIHSEYNSGQFVSLQPKLCVTRFPILWALNNLERNKFPSFLIVSVTCSLKQTDLLKQRWECLLANVEFMNTLSLTEENRGFLNRSMLALLTDCISGGAVTWGKWFCDRLTEPLGSWARWSPGAFPSPCCYNGL